MTCDAYDAKGNLTTDEKGNRYAYAAENRLVEERNAVGGPIIGHSYDRQGRCVTEIRNCSGDVE